MQQHSIVLVGLSGSGKSSVARVLARQLGWPLFDTDQLIEQLAGCAIPEIFAQAGEAQFRDYEAQALGLALRDVPGIIATGAGIVLRVENRAALQAGCLVVWLDAPTPLLVARLQAHDEQRPLLAGTDPTARLDTQRSQREALYAEVAQLRIDTTNLSHSQVAEQIITRL